MTARGRIAAACAHTEQDRLPVDFGGGSVFAALHNVQAMTPIENLLALCETVTEYR